jgi:hypothetical protein
MRLGNTMPAVTVKSSAATPCLCDGNDTNIDNGKKTAMPDVLGRLRVPRDTRRRAASARRMPSYVSVQRAHRCPLARSTVRL